MARAVLGRSGGVKVALDGDCGNPRPRPCAPIEPEPVESPLMSMEIRLRKRTGIDEESGNPVFEWTPVAAERAMLFEQRQESDPDAGVTIVKAKVVLSNDAALETVPETAVVVDPASGEMWRITSSAVTPDRIEIEATRVEQQKTGD